MQTLPERAFSPVEKRQALDLVLQSQTFARADQLRKFLRYICEMDEAGRADEITEYGIATEALGRPRSYSPAADSGVRGRAHDLRLKLDQFYETENPKVKLRIELRKGSYTPFFYEVEPGHEMLPFVLPVSQGAIPAQRATTNRVRNAVAIVVLVAGAVVTTRAFYIRRTTQLDPIVKQFWGPLVRPGANVLLCLGTPPSLLIKPYEKPPNPDVFRPLIADESAWYSRMRLPHVAGQPYIYFSGDSPLFGDAEAAAFAVRVLSAAGASFDFIPENTAQPAALRNQNVLLIGSPNYSEYAARILKRTPFTIVEDSKIGEEVIREQAGNLQSPKVFIPRRDESGSLVLVYGLITVFQNQTLSDVSSRTIMVSGVTGAASGAAMHFFGTASGLRTLLDRLHKEGLKGPPPAYQLVVKGTRDRALSLAWDLADFRQMAHFSSLEY